jgi:hypothetical protein
MGSSSGVAMVVLIMGTVSACQANVPQRSNIPRTLTSVEMDHVTAGSSVAINEAMASAIGTAPATIASGSASSDSEIGLIVPILDYASSKALAFAHGEDIAKTRLSGSVSVRNNVGTVELDGLAEGIGSNRAKATAQLYGIATKSADLVFGSITAAACCNPEAEDHSNIFAKTSGGYTTELRSLSRFYTPEEHQSRVDIAVVVSAFPIFEQSQVSLRGASTQVSQK